MQAGRQQLARSLLAPCKLQHDAQGLSARLRVPLRNASTFVSAGCLMTAAGTKRGLASRTRSLCDHRTSLAYASYASCPRIGRACAQSKAATLSTKSEQWLLVYSAPPCVVHLCSVLAITLDIIHTCGLQCQLSRCAAHNHWRDHSSYAYYAQRSQLPLTLCPSHYFCHGYISFCSFSPARFKTEPC